MNDEYRIEEPKKSKIKIISLLLALAAVLIFAFVIYFFTKVNQATSSVSVPVNLTIDKGMNTRQVAARLSQEGIVDHPWIFTAHVYLKGAGNKIQAGNYLLDRKMSIAEVTQIITAGKVVSNEYKITIIEGWTNTDIAQHLERREIFKSDDFLAATVRDYDFSFGEGSASGGKFNADAKSFKYQGFLFPDTYHLKKDADASELVKKMLKNFESKIDAEMEAAIEAKNLKLFDVITLASIVEKEVGRNKGKLSAEDLELMQKERELVASVFYNRLAKGVALQSDATVNYVTGKQDRQVSLEDAKIKSPYNTYLNKGLPPSPISNPGLGSIKAAINPANSDYLYFLNKVDGEAVLARTLEEHNANKARHLE